MIAPAPAARRAFVVGRTGRGGEETREAEGDGSSTRRRWDAADTNRLNAAHWRNAGVSQSMNADLADDLNDLRDRATFEIANHGYLAGMVSTFTDDVVGRSGPALNVRSESDQGYADRLEAEWREWWASPDYTGVLSGVDMLNQWERTTFSLGEFIIQKVVDSGARTKVRMRLATIDPRRLGSPITGSRSDIVLGVELDSRGRPVRYWIRTNDPSIEGFQTLDAKPFRAADIIHGFRQEESGQVRGYPRVAPVLQPAADLRDYGNQVLDAARLATDYAIVMYALNVDAENEKFDVTNECVELERRMMTSLPPGYDAKQLKPEQPSTGYDTFVREKLREIGRPLRMPLMILRADSSESNFSSARFDAQVYQRGIRCEQGWLERTTLNPLLADVEREALLATGERPSDLVVSWTWEGLPHVDPVKEANAERIGMANGTLSARQAIAARGGVYEDVMAELRREHPEREDLGLPLNVVTGEQSDDENLNATDDDADAGGGDLDAPGSNGAASRFAMNGAGTDG